MSKAKKTAAAPVVPQSFDDFLSLVQNVAPDTHAKIVGHPEFDEDEHNSFTGASSLDGAMTDDEMLTMIQAILASANTSDDPRENGADLMFGSDGDTDDDGADLDDEIKSLEDAD